jgi:hypothetical protein
MKPAILIVLFILLTSSAVFAQSECEKASEKAKSDFKNSRFSLHSKEILPNEATFYYVLKTDYGISSHTTDSLDFYSCYDSTMKELLKGKYGAEFFQRTKNIADSLENTENWKKDAEFPDGPNAMHKFIIDRLSLAYIKKGGVNKRLLIQIEIDSTGKAKNPIIQQGVNNELDRNAIYIVNQMPKWKPAYLFGKTINQTVIIPIDVDYK